MCRLHLQKTAQAPFGLRFNLLDSRELGFTAPQLLWAVAFWGSDREQVGSQLSWMRSSLRGAVGYTGHDARFLAALGRADLLCDCSATWTCPRSPEGARETGLHRQEPSAGPFLLLSPCSSCWFLSTSQKTAGCSVAGLGLPLHQPRPVSCCAVTLGQGTARREMLQHFRVLYSSQFPSGMKFPGQDHLFQPI